MTEILMTIAIIAAVLSSAVAVIAILYVRELNRQMDYILEELDSVDYLLEDMLSKLEADVLESQAKMFVVNAGLFPTMQ